MSIPAGAVVSQLLAWPPRLQAGGRSNSAKPKSVLGTVAATAPSLAFFQAPKSPKQNGGLFRAWKKREDGRWDGGGFFKALP